MRKISVVISVCALAIGAWIIWTMTRPDSENHQPTDAAVEHSESISVVVLSEQKIQAADIATAPAVMRTLQEIRGVPGRLQYDAAQHIAVTAASDGVVTNVCVKPGDGVAAGDLLAVVNSPEVGYARANVLRCRGTVEVALAKQQWEDALCTGLETLVEAVEADADVAAILEDMGEVTLGAHRGDVLTAYSRYQLARTISENTTAIAESGAIAGRVVQERTSERNAAEATLRAVTEQSLFEARQARATAAMEAIDAEQRLRIAEQHLVTLLGYEETLTQANLPEPLSVIEVRAPLNGTVESKVFSNSERIRQGDEMFVLADTTSLWVAADIREREWSALRLTPGQTFEVVVPALEDQSLTATLHFLGRQVMPATNAVPLVGTLNNEEGVLRPGQFVRVNLPIGPAREVLAVPSSAIVEHEGQAFVFVRESDTRFCRADVTTGLVESGWTEIVSGLSADDAVVSRGAFAVKSELLLETEE